MTIESVLVYLINLLSVDAEFIASKNILKIHEFISSCCVILILYLTLVNMATFTS